MAAGDLAAARATLSEAQHLCDELGVAPSSELAVGVASLRTALSSGDADPR